MPAAYLIGSLRFKALVYQLRGRTIFHGVALEDPSGLGVLIFGSPKSGKTTIALELIRQQGYKLISDDLIFISNNVNGLYVHPINNKHLLVRNKKNIMRVRQECNLVSSSCVKVHRVYTLDSYVDYTEYLTGKVYNLHRIPNNFRKYWIKMHIKIVTKLVEIEPENIQ